MGNQTGIRVLLIVIVAIVVFVLVAYNNRNKARLESETFAALQNGRRQQQRSSLEDDLDADVDMSDGMQLKGEDGRKKKVSREDTGKFLINEGKGQYAPAEFEKATRAKTLEDHKQKMEESPVTGGVKPYEPVTDEVYRPVDPSETTPEGSSTVKDAYPGEKLKIDVETPDRRDRQDRCL